MAGNGEEHVVEIGGVDRQLRNLDAGIIELLEHAAQRGDIAVVGHAQDQVVLLARAGRERALGRVQGIRVGELQPDMAARDASSRTQSGTNCCSPVVPINFSR